MSFSNRRAMKMLPELVDQLEAAVRAGERDLCRRGKRGGRPLGPRGDEGQLAEEAACAPGGSGQTPGLRRMLYPKSPKRLSTPVIAFRSNTGRTPCARTICHRQSRG